MASSLEFLGATVRNEGVIVVIGRVDYASWLFRVIAWDALLPAIVVLVPTAIEWLAPNRRGFIELVSVLLPLSAFFIRYRAGKRRITSNNCSRVVQRFQFVVFCIGILPLALLECFLILVTPTKLLAHGGDRKFFAALFGVYLTAMVIAMYPGRSALTKTQIEEMEAFPFIEG